MQGSFFLLFGGVNFCQHLPLKTVYAKVVDIVFASMHETACRVKSFFSFPQTLLGYFPEGRPGIYDAPPPPPPVWNLRAVSLIPLFYISSFVFLPSPVALSDLSFSAFAPSS